MSTPRIQNSSEQEAEADRTRSSTQESPRFGKDRGGKAYGSDDLARCVEIGRRVLKALEQGADRAVVYGKPRKERVDGVRTIRVE